MKKIFVLFATICFECFLSNFSHAQAPGWLWAKSYGGTGYDRAASSAVDASGNFYLAGSFNSPTITFGTTTLTTAGNNDIFLVKFDANRNVLWAKSEGGTTSDRAISIAVDASENIYLAGTYESPTITFGNKTLTNAGGTDLFFVKYDANGNVLWAKSAGGTKNDGGSSLALDSSGNIYLTGSYCSSSITFGSIVLSGSGNGHPYLFLVKYDGNGNVLWAENATGSDVYGTSLAVDASGNPYVSGITSGSIRFSSYYLSNPNDSRVFFAKYSANGNFLWAKIPIGSSENYATNYIALDASGNLYLAGSYDSPTITFDNTALTNAGQTDIYLAKFDANGNVLWAKSEGGKGIEYVCSLLADASGNLYLGGNFKNWAIGTYTLKFGTYNLIETDHHLDIFLTKYNTSGDVLWAKSADGTSNDLHLNSLTLDASGNVYLAAYASTTVIFGNDTLTGLFPNSGDIFLAASGSNITGINELNGSLKISIFPNPATEIVAIETSEVPCKSELSIINTYGKALITRQITESKMQFDISSLPSGIYFVRVMGEKIVQVGKFIKQ